MTLYLSVLMAEMLHDGVSYCYSGKMIMICIYLLYHINNLNPYRKEVTTGEGQFLSKRITNAVQCALF